MNDIRLEEKPVVSVGKEVVKEQTEKQNNSRRTKTSYLTKECDVLVYNKKNNTAIISFDGFGFELKNVSRDPGERVTVKYTGKVHSSKFSIEMIK